MRGDSEIKALARSGVDVLAVALEGVVVTEVDAVCEG
jgi:hypothetical protein